VLVDGCAQAHGDRPEDAVPGGVACGLVPFVCAGGYDCAFFEREAGTDDDLTR